MKDKKYLIFLFLSIMVLLLIVFYPSIKLKNSNGVRDYNSIKKEGVLRVVTDYSVVGYYVSGDTIAGFNHDVLELLKTKYMPFDVDITLESSLDKSLEGLATGKFDLLASNVPITKELRKYIAFTNPIVRNKQVLIQRVKKYNNAQNPIRSHLDLANKTLYVSKNSPVILRIKNLSSEIGDTIYYKESQLYSDEQLIMKVAGGEIDYAVCDEQAAKRLASIAPEVDYSTLIGFTHLEAWVVNNNSPILLDSLNTWIKRLAETEEYNQLLAKYFLQ